MPEIHHWLESPQARRLRGRDLLSPSDLTPDEQRWLLDFAAALKAAGIEGGRTLLPGCTIALIFRKPSTRTRVSFEVAAWQLGAMGLYLNAQDLQIPRGETMEDTGRVLSRYVQAIVIRTFAQEEVEALARGASVPVINGLTDSHHPCQVLADLLTLKEHFGQLEGRHLVYVGDGNNMANSLLIGCAGAGMKVTVCTPPGYEPDASAVEEARRRAAATGGEVRLTTDPAASVVDADAVYTDVWASMGQEAEAAERRRVFASYQVNESLMAKAPAGAVVLHCLPAHRGEEITSGVLEGPSSLVWTQAENRLHVQKALLAALIGPREGVSAPSLEGSEPLSRGLNTTN